jgi:hypothetical protein
MADKEKIKCGKGKRITDNFLSVTVNPDILKDYIEEYEGHKFVRLNISIVDKPDQYGKDVYITINDWKPNTQSKSDKGISYSEKEEPQEEDSELGF